MLRAVLLATFLASSALAQTPFAVEGQLRLHGSNTIGSELAPDLVTAYGKQAGLTGVHVEQGADGDERTIDMSGAESARRLRGEVVAHGTGTAFPALHDGRADIGMASRPATDAERTSLKDAGVGDPAAEGNTTVLSLDGVIVIVHPDNRAGTLTMDQVRGLFTGAIRNWSEVGGADRPVALYVRDDKSGTTDTFKALALGGAGFAQGNHAFQSSEDLADAVASDPGGVGFVGFAYARNTKPVILRLACGLQFAPKPFLVRTEEYPLARRLFLYTPTRKPPLVVDFLRFAQSEAAQPIVDHAGFISLTPELGDEEDRNARLMNFGRGVPGADLPAFYAQTRQFTYATTSAHRLSPTFRFEFDQARLDARAGPDLGRVAAWFKKNPGRSLILIGHSSNQGGFAYNVDLSKRRADDIAARLRQLGVTAAETIGVGTVSPVACDDEQTRGGLNRRVEVWVR